MHQWNVVGYVLDEDEEASTTALGSIELGEEDHFDDDRVLDALVDGEFITAEVDLEELQITGDNNVVFIADANGAPFLSLNRDLRWG